MVRAERIVGREMHRRIIEPGEVPGVPEYAGGQSPLLGLEFIDRDHLAPAVRFLHCEMRRRYLDS